MTQLHGLAVSGGSDEWTRAGFTVDEAGQVVIGSTSLRLVDEAGRRGVLAAEVAATGLATDSDVGFDGLPIRAIDEPTSPPAMPDHPNRVTAIDHIVAMTPDLDRTADALADSGLELRRRRDATRDGAAVHQLFYWLGDVILEVVADPRLPPDAPARFWGLALVTSDLDEAVHHLGDLVGTPREAVQPGRRIASLRRSAGLSVPLAFMSPHR